MKRLSIVVGLLAGMMGEAAGQDVPLSKVLVENEGWREVARDWPRVSFLDAEPGGTIAIYQGALVGRLGLNGKVERVTMPEVLDRSQATAVRPGIVYAIDPVEKAVLPFIDGGKREKLKLEGLMAPVCLTLWPDQGHLVIGEAHGAWLWAVRLEADGTFGPGDRYYSLRTRRGEETSTTALTMDAGQLLYACTPLGIQVFDPTGRLSGVIPAPAPGEMTALTIGGPGADTLYVACGDRIHARKIQGKAIHTLKKPG
jgi:hypothetical protein